MVQEWLLDLNPERFYEDCKFSWQVKVNQMNREFHRKMESGKFDKKLNIRYGLGGSQYRFYGKYTKEMEELIEKHSEEHWEEGAIVYEIINEEV